MKRFWIFVLIAGIAIAAMSAFHHFMRVGKGDPAPLFALPSLGNQEIALEGYRGKPVLLHFFATWCVPCIKEFPTLIELQSELTDKGLVVLAISEDEDIPALKGFVDHVKPDFPVLIDMENKVADSYQSYAVPESFLISGEGIVLWRHTGPGKWGSAKMRDKIVKLITE